MGDLIERQAALDALKAARTEDDGTYNWRAQRNLDLEFAGELLETIPSAQPEVLAHGEGELTAQPATSCSEIPNSSTDCISRQAAIDALHMHLMYRMGTDSNKKRLDEWINNLPSVQPKRKKGKWILVNGNTSINCSCCYHCSWSLSFEDTVRQFNFCPNCGADMRGGGE